MNRTACQNQSMRRCGTQSMTSENNTATMRQTMSRQMRVENNSGTCGCTENSRAMSENGWQREVPTANRGKLLNYIDEVSFGAYEALLYLDTHPDCPDGLRYFRENNEKRQFAVKEYARLYGPLNPDRAQVTCGTTSWEWVNQPWPWEGGAC